MATLVSITQAAHALGLPHAALLAILGEAPGGIVTSVGAWTRIDLDALQAWVRTFGESHAAEPQVVEGAL
jgi:uncharacterized membrane protein YphA (DoxX/SURF4 family)